jgi:predicted transcriptional regulator
MLNIAASLIGPLELAIMECFWEKGPQSSGTILATLRKTRPIAATTVTTTLARLFEQGLLTRTLDDGRKMPWIYTARYASRGALIAGVVGDLCAYVAADRADRAEALAVLRGTPR